MMKTIFVFGSNLAGVHGAGAAKYAHNFLGAEWGVGEGMTGSCYALPTKDHNIESRDLDDVGGSIRKMFEVMRENRDSLFVITPVGCGLAGFNPRDIIGLIRDEALKPNAPSNWVLSRGWVSDGHI